MSTFTLRKREIKQKREIQMERGKEKRERKKERNSNRFIKKCIPFLYFNLVRVIRKMVLQNWNKEECKKDRKKKEKNGFKLIRNSRHDRPPTHPTTKKSLREIHSFFKCWNDDTTFVSSKRRYLEMLIVWSNEVDRIGRINFLFKWR